MRITTLLTSLATAALLATTATAQSPLTTLYANNNSGSVGGTVYFDLTLNVGVGITSLDCNILSGSGAIDVYTTALGGTYAGNEGTPGAWSLIGSSTVPATISPAGTPTNFPFATPIVVTPGTYGIAIVHNGMQATYTNGTGANQTYSNVEMTLNAGSATNGTVGTGGAFTPRVWNGGIHYSPGANFATTSSFGSGCLGDEPASFYELFDGAGNVNDLPTTGWTALFAGSNYLILNVSTNGFVTPTGTPFTFADDDTQQFTLPNTMAIPGGTTGLISVCSNGFVGLGTETSTQYLESTAELLGTSAVPRFCPYWDDFNPSAGGQIFAEETNLDGVFHVTWQGVPEYGTTNSNVFQISLDTNTGTVEVNYGAMASLDGIVGYSPGNGVMDPGSVDITALPTGTLTLGTDRPNLVLTPGNRPVIGGPPATATLSNIPAASNGLPGVYLLGLSIIDPMVDLGLIGMPGCGLGNDGGLASFPFAISATTDASLSVPITGNVAGLQVGVQGVVLAPGANPLGVGTSNGLVWNIDIN